MKLSDFDFHLPQKLIAQNPASPRDACRLMVLDRTTENLHHQRFYDLPSLLKPGDVLVFNDSKVIPARIPFTFKGKKGEILLTEKLQNNMWLAIGKPGKLLETGAKIPINEEVNITIESIQKDGQRVVTFSCKNSKKDVNAILEKIGVTPLPPYIEKSTSSAEDYQTIYAKKEGSIAAPTAGLHFTKQLISRLEQKGIIAAFVTLHVGLGTFLPVKTDNVVEHQMHYESFSINQKTANILNTAIRDKRRIIAVGTTSVRVLETACDDHKNFRAMTGKTQKFIYPGYQWKCVEGLITNFHLPKSTLLLLTSAFANKNFILKAYQQAIRKGYHFYSFGDAMIIL